MNAYKAIGCMSGTSLDGLDILYVLLAQDDAGCWTYKLQQARTLPYPEDLHARLAEAVYASGLELARLHADYGHFVGRALKDFVKEYALQPDFAAVHGHTVFHQPQNGFGLQIGDGAAMAAESGLMIVNNFRATDIALGGQGAPLVPIGDELLFSEYDFCLNLGGISNISYKNSEKQRIAFDISPCNMALNHYARKLGAAYDAGGDWARSGRLLPGLKEALDRLPYYALPAPKTLGFEWFGHDFLPVVQEWETKGTEQDLLHTLVEHIAFQIGRACRNADLTAKMEGKPRTLLLTGGGALNTYLKERIQVTAQVETVAASKMLIDYKEALIFALLGALRLQKQANCLHSVTGARRDNIGGAVYLP
ncbi:MAG: anhydro-N-acetylmuramic acid kinase [Bacteroides sp.]|nr:anhydro-N-acetylmuramic acid kinase [Ruminococcus flavefaciens]MCM1555423.1 anhydro-N-acetylmuramic acid kinase [Bacteroides sp.]